MTRVAIVAAAADAGLAGFEGVRPWGDARIVDPADAPGTDAGLFVALGGAPLPGEPPARRVRFADPAAPAADEPGVARIAPRGDGLWSRAPWPAADALFDLPPPGTGAGFLVAGATAERREEVVGRLAAHDARAEPVAELSATALVRATAVVLLDDDAAALPARAMAVLAGRRLLIAHRPATAFGLQPGIEYLGCAMDDDAAFHAEAVSRHPEAFDALRAMGALAAERHRASLVYGRLVADLELAGAATRVRPEVRPRIGG
jgi:hypothetical protein